ncbi:MAG: hypothetical protein WGN25_10090 [Candidatus Electrothrix sp. GW3-4]|uniref:hypothetical protein n=1 Tax=Candidatus Electrothrix sp. GW3-4 TaxID=3126740 RepID=UPI0030CE0F2F
MKLKVLAQAAVLVVLSAGVAFAGGRAFTCDDCSDECLENPYSKGCPPVCKDPGCQASQTSCDDCSDECKKNPYGADCPEICRDVACQSCEDCTDECKINPYGDGCPDICRDIKCYSCDDCSVECIENPEGQGCPPVCDELGCNICDKFPTDCPVSCKEGSPDQENCPTECQDVPEECLSEDPSGLNAEITCDDCPPECEDDPYAEGCPAECQELNCYGAPAGPLRFVGDLGYLRLSDPADYLFARLGVEYSPFTGTSLENLSFLAMAGAAPKLDGSDGDDALLLDVFAQYNWSGAFDGFIGLGFGAWITDNDSDLDSDDSDLDFLANIGARVYGDPDGFNISVFLEARNAVDELSDMDQYGRYGIGLRFQR